MWRSRWVVLLAVCGCGRSGFGVQPDARDVDGLPVDPFDAPAGSVVVTFGETPTATVKGVTRDTYISNDTTTIATYNFGASTRLLVEGTQARTLIRFDVSSLPPTGQLLSARMHLSVTSFETSPTIMMLPVTEAWTEGTQSGTAGVANFTQRTSTQSWTTAGAGAGSTGAALASTTITTLGSIGIDVPVATIQSWRDAPSTNFGLAITTSGDLSLSSSNDTQASSRPELVVTYFP